MIQYGQPLAGTLLVVLVMSSVDANQPMSAAAARSALGQTTQNMTPLSPLESQRADTWQISESEWRRYQSLMEGVRGSISPANLSPIEVLGIHARDEAERRRYAERWAQMMRDDADRILAFQ
ncbi:MAG: TIGR03759 family integrating conjugative element protein, partial [Thiohalocapsa sp.]